MSIVVLPLRAIEVRRRVPELLDQLPTRIAGCLRNLLEHATRLEAKALQYEREIKAHVRTNALARGRMGTDSRGRDKMSTMTDYRI